MGENAQRITIEQADGDSPWLGAVPKFLRGMARSLDTFDETRRNARMIRIVQALYPTLCAFERKTRGTKDDGTPARLRLDGVPFESAVNSDRSIERGLMVFDEAWQAGEIVLRAANGKRIPPSRGKVSVPACGYSVDHVRQYFVDRAARIILRRVPDVYDRVADSLTDTSLLPRLRLVGSLPPAVINEIVRGFHGDVRKALFGTDDSVLEAITRINPRVLKALRETLDQEFARLMQSGSEKLAAIADAFTVPEQVQDLGKTLMLLETPDAIRAVGRWDIRDETDRINQERKRKDIPPLKVPAHTTDIRVLQGVLGGEFNHLIEFSVPPLLDVFGQSVREMRTMDPSARQARLEHMGLFCQRFMPYLNADSVIGLFLLAPEDQAKVPDALSPNITEVFHILEGLWGKKGYGRKFFETVIGTEDGGKALRLMMHDLVGLKKRGSFKSGEDLTQIVANSDLLDSHILKYMAKK